MTPSFLRRVLEEPSYGWSRDGGLCRPTNAELLREWRSRMNVWADRKAWLSVSSWFWTCALIPFGVVFLTRYFTWPLMLAGFLYAMVGLGTHGTVWFHRFSTHRAFAFRNAAYRFVCRNLAIKIVAEETYVVSHLVHHSLSDQPGDPYNAQAGWLYCFLAAEVHQPVNRTLSVADYERLRMMVRHTGMHTNDHATYMRWGSVAHPGWTTLHYALSWLFWYGAFFAVGGHPLATAIFGWSAVWAIGIRAHNYDLHAGGNDRRREGVDFESRIAGHQPGLAGDRRRRVAQQSSPVSEQRPVRIPPLAARHRVCLHPSLRVARRSDVRARLSRPVLRAVLRSVPGRERRGPRASPRHAVTDAHLAGTLRAARRP